MTTYAQQANSGKDSGGNGGHNSHNSGGGNSYSSSHNNSNTTTTSNNNNNSNSSDGSKKEEFRKYLEKTGVLDTLTKILVGLYEEPERPANAVEYIKRYLGAPKNVDVVGLQRENEQLRRQLAALSVTDTADTSHTANDSKNPSSST